MDAASLSVRERSSWQVFDSIASPNVISYSLKNNANGDSFKEIGCCQLVGKGKVVVATYIIDYLRGCRGIGEP